MSTGARIGCLLLFPLVVLGALAFGAFLLLFDLVTTPLVWLRRHPTGDEAPKNTNATIIVLNWNGQHFLQELMPSLRVAVDRCPGDHEVLVVDNGSEDGSVEWLEREHPWARTLPLPDNRHFIRGNLAGVEAANPARDLLVFLNNDMRVEPDFLVELLRPFGEPDAADLFAVTARIEMAGERSETGLARTFVKKGELRFVQRPGTPADDGTAVLWAGGGSSAFARGKHDAIGGFESLYVPCYVEDVSLSFEAWRRGWRSRYAHGSVVHHAHRGTSTRVFGREGVERLDWRNRELFFVRAITAPWLVVQHAFWFGYALHKQARRRGVPLALGVAAAWSTLPRLPAALRERLRSRCHARLSAAAVLANVSDPDR